MRGREVSYNERLFGGGGIRSWYHNARYHWISRQMLSQPPDASLFELGCFDAKLTDFLPNGFGRYVGVDANWEGGLDLARQRFAGRRDITLIEMREPADLLQFENKSFDVAVAMETLEHLAEDILTGYLEQIARITKGPFFVTVPNEMGPVFLAKYTGKLVGRVAGQRYRPAEILAAATFRSHAVERDQHKGFDYRRLAEKMDRLFEVETIEPVPNMPIPVALGLSIGIVARAR